MPLLARGVVVVIITSVLVAIGLPVVVGGEFLEKKFRIPLKNPGFGVVSVIGTSVLVTTKCGRINT